MQPINNALIDKLVDCFNDVYAKLYLGTYPMPSERYHELIDRFDGNGGYDYDYDRDVLMAFNAHRHDVVASDREAAAFMVAYDYVIG